MTRGEIWKDFFKRTVLPAVIALFLFFMFKNVFTEDGKTVALQMKSKKFANKMQKMI